MAYEKFGKNLNVVFKVSSVESSSSLASVICNCANSNNWIRELSFQLKNICRLNCCNEINLIIYGNYFNDQIETYHWAHQLYHQPPL